MNTAFPEDRYQIGEPISRDGMSTIYRARDMQTGRIVAIKVLRDEYSTDPKFITRFQISAKTQSALHHPNIVQAYDYFQSNGKYCIVMELIEGTDLRRHMRSRQDVLDIDRAVMIAHSVALGLGAAHQRGIVHRSVIPQNILIGRDGSIKLTGPGMTLGTVHYFSPEQAQGEMVTPAADVYSLGIVLYEMLTGRPAFDGDTPVAVAMAHIQDAPTPPSQLNLNIPQGLEAIILRCLEKKHEMRYQNGDELARALEIVR